MINVNQIERLIEQNEFVRLVERVLGNGRCNEPAIRQRLAQPDLAPVTGRALALQRTLELSFGPTRMASGLVRSLLRLQLSSGSFSPGEDDEIVTTAVAVRALCEAEYALSDQSEVGSAIHNAIQALGRMQLVDGRFSDDPVTNAIALWQLGPLTEACSGAVDLIALHDVVARTSPGALRREALAAAA